VSQELKPCPFCGTNVLSVAKISSTGPVEEWPWVVSCESGNCAIGPITNDYATRDEAIAAWNTRSDAHLLRSHEALREALRGWKELFADDMPFIIAKVGGGMTNGDQDAIDRVLIATDAALTEAAAQEPQKEQHHD